MEFIIHKNGGKFTNIKDWKNHTDSLPNGSYLVKISSANKRSINQNSYLHAVLIPEFRKALNDVGYNEVKTDQQAKLIIKKMFLTQQVPNVNTGEVLEYVKDTHDLTTVEMMTLFEEVIQFAAQNMNYQIAYPNEQLKMEYQ